MTSTNFFFLEGVVELEIGFLLEIILPGVDDLGLFMEPFVILLSVEGLLMLYIGESTYSTSTGSGVSDEEGPIPARPPPPLSIISTSSRMICLSSVSTT